MTRQYDGVRPVVEGTLEGDTWTTTAVNYWEGPSYYSPLVLRLLPSGTYSDLADGLGSTRQLMRNSDHSITDTYDYDAFGNPIVLMGATDSPYRYLGVMGYRKDQNGLYQLGVRTLHPTIGRLAQRDRVSPLADWAYALDNPMLYMDPTGYWAVTLGAYCVFGLTMQLGQNPDSGWFLGGNFGVGLGGGFGYTSTGTSIGWTPTPVDGFPGFEGWYGGGANIGGSLGPLSGGLSWCKGKCVGVGMGKSGYGGFGADWGITPFFGGGTGKGGRGWGLGIGAAAGLDIGIGYRKGPY